jgi:acyl-coenzyme A thioesterase PaaI-like protein
MQKLIVKPWALKYLLPLWPPFLGTGVSVEHVSADLRLITVSMKLHWYNRNFVGTQFGGGMCAMTDPFYMVMLFNALGPDYYVWDKAGQIEFIKPGRSKLSARFEINEGILDDIRRHTGNGEKYFKVLPVDITDAQGELVAKVQRTLYIRKKPHLR